MAMNKTDFKSKANRKVRRIVIITAAAMVVIAGVIVLGSNLWPGLAKAIHLTGGVLILAGGVMSIPVMVYLFLAKWRPDLF